MNYTKIFMSLNHIHIYYKTCHSEGEAVLTFIKRAHGNEKISRCSFKSDGYGNEIEGQIHEMGTHYLDNIVSELDENGFFDESVPDNVEGAVKRMLIVSASGYDSEGNLFERERSREFSDSETPYDPTLKKLEDDVKKIIMNNPFLR